MEIWMHAFSVPRQVAPLARQAEAWGFDGIMLADSQNLAADIWVELALAGAATERIHLGPGVTNFATRHPAVTAAAANTLQIETGGRVVCGVARGDSAVTQLGRRPQSPAEFERDLVRFQRYLRGEEVDLDGVATRIQWPEEYGRAAKVPVSVMATGPRVLGIAARHAERVDVTVGAEPERVAWAISTVRDACAPGADAPSIGACVNVAVHPDRAVARDLVRGSTALFARFNAEGAPPNGLSDVTRDGIQALATGYDRARHGLRDAPQARELSSEFIDRFTAAGPADEVCHRLRALAELGLDRLVIVPCSRDADPALVAESNERFATDVLPRLR